MPYTKLEVQTMAAIRRKLCSRMREHGFRKIPLAGSECDGVGLVCGFCQHTADQQMEALKTGVPALGEVFGRSPV